MTSSMDADPKAGIQHPQFQQLKHKVHHALGACCATANRSVSVSMVNTNGVSLFARLDRAALWHWPPRTEAQHHIARGTVQVSLHSPALCAEALWSCAGTRDSWAVHQSPSQPSPHLCGSRCHTTRLPAGVRQRWVPEDDGLQRGRSSWAQLVCLCVGMDCCQHPLLACELLSCHQQCLEPAAVPS